MEDRKLKSFTSLIVVECIELVKDAECFQQLEIQHIPHWKKGIAAENGAVARAIEESLLKRERLHFRKQVTRRHGRDKEETVAEQDEVEETRRRYGKARGGSFAAEAGRRRRTRQGRHAPPRDTSGYVGDPLGCK